MGVREQTLPDALSAPVTVHAGPLRATFDPSDGSLRHVRLGGCEVLRRIYVAVRDSSWDTLPTVLSGLSLESNAEAGTFDIEFWATCDKGPMVFSWQGSIKGDALGNIAYVMNGRAESDLMSNRIGFCVLHPIDECQGKRCTVETVDGGQSKGRFPTTIHPHLPFANVRAMTHEVTPGVSATVRLEGDTFETEDQRQWGDASFKTYSRPLALPKPFDLAAGQSLRQSVHLSLQGVANAAPSILQNDHKHLGVDVTVKLDKSRRMLDLGLSLPAGVPVHTEAERERLRALKLRHLRLDLAPVRSESFAQLRRAVDEAKALSLPIDLALHLTRNPGGEMSRVCQVLEELSPKLCGVSLGSLVDGNLSEPALKIARKSLSHVVPDVPIGMAFHPHFTEVNRNRDAALGGKFVSVPLSPQVHATDPMTMAENIPAPGWMMETLREFSPTVMPLVLAPISLRPLPRGGAPDDTAGGQGGAPGWVDPRQSSLLAAAWTIGHLGHLTWTNITRATYYQTRGWLGVMWGEETHLRGQGQEDTVLPGAVFPLYHVLADLADFGKGESLKVKNDDERAVGVLAVQTGKSLRVLLANLSNIPNRVNLTLAGGGALNWLRRLNDKNVDDACIDPVTFRATSSTPWDGGPIDMGPYEIVRIDGQA